MAPQDEGRWDVSIKSNAVCLERISDGDKQLFEDVLAPEEARKLAGLLTKYADKADEAGKSEDSEKSDKSKDKDSDKDEDSDKDKDSDKDEDSDKSKDEDSDKSDDSDESSD
ncbi:hypothetical protein [Mycobacterium sp. 1081908.1]|uniref:hypothetical protein n=1 Tax=Mycobacterium sp. 1081908.1 TaxID=1834066 RepID=UPI0008011FEB|nr:hypothetical protein [Mycobacterium sp. 1081908.1]OBK44612.1 hypothetical protein A5655_14000 [Mycobacterium sp. 1081908.1]